MLSAGEIAPDFTLPDQDGNEVRLSILGGHLSSCTSTRGPIPRAAQSRPAGSAIEAPTTKQRAPGCWESRPIRSQRSRNSRRNSTLISLS